MFLMMGKVVIVDDGDICDLGFEDSCEVNARDIWDFYSLPS